MIRTLVRTIQDFGLLNASKHYAIQVINKITFFNVYRILLIDRPNSRGTVLDPKYQCKFLEPHEILAYVNRPEFNLSEDFVRQALQKGDRCCAILDRDVLATYCWYSTQVTSINQHLQIACPPGYVYSYHDYTHTDYRRQRLQTVRSAQGLQDTLSRGAKGVIGYVDENNFPAIRSLERRGGRFVGRIVAIHLFGEYRIYHSKGSAALGVRITPKQT